MGANLAVSTEVYCTDYDILYLWASDAQVLGRDSGSVKISYVIDGNPSVEYHPSRAAPLPVGEHVLKISAQDAAGNISAHVLTAHVRAHEGADDVSAPSTELSYINSYDDGAGRVYMREGFWLHTAEDLSGLFATVYKIDPSPELLELGLSSSTLDQFDWYWDEAVDLPEGVHTLAYGAVDYAGNYEVLKTTTVYVDATPPSAPEIVSDHLYRASPEIDSWAIEWIAQTGMSAPIMVRPDSQLYFTFADPESNGVASGPRAAYALFGDEQTWPWPQMPTDTSGAGYQAAGNDRITQVSYFSEDNVGNSSGGSWTALVVDGTAPENSQLTVNNIPADISGGVIHVGDYDQLGFLAADPPVEGFQFPAHGVYKLDDLPYAEAYEPFNLVPGTYTLTWHAEDLVGNAEAAEHSVTVVSEHLFDDLDAPVSELGSLGTPYSEGDKLWFGTSGWRIGASDALSGVAATYYKLNPPQELLEAGLNAGTVSDFEVAAGTIGAQAGQVTVAYGSVDRAGNYEQLKTSTIYFDLTPPTVDGWLNGSLATSTEVYCTDYDTLYIWGEDAFEPDRNDNPVRISYILDGGNPTDFISNRAAPLSIGEHQLTIMATDAVGNISSHTVVAHVRAHEGEDDVMPPSTDMYSFGSYDDGAGRLYIHGEFGFGAWDDASGLYAVVYKVDPSPELLAQGLSSNTIDQFDWYWDGTIGVEDGAHTIAYGAVDYAGNYEVLKTTTVYVDNNPPNVPAIVSDHMYWTSWEDTWAIDWMVERALNPIIISPTSQLWFPFEDPEVNGVASGPKAAYALFGDEQTWPWPQMPTDTSGPGYQVGGEDRLIGMSYYSEDNIGHISDGSWAGILVDATPPSDSWLTVNGSSVDTSVGIVYVGDYDKLDITAQDPPAMGLASPAHGLYKLDDLPYGEAFESFNLVPGTYTLTWRGVDLAGNQELTEHTVTVISEHLFDDVAPPATYMGTGANVYSDGVNVWFGMAPWGYWPVDDLSGVAATYYKINPSAELVAGGLTPETTSNFDLYAGTQFDPREGPLYMAYGSVDKVGNYANLRVRTIYFDGTGPSLGIGLNGSITTFDGSAKTTDAITLEWADQVSTGIPAGLQADTIRYVIDRAGSSCADVLPENVNPEQPPGSCENPVYAGAFKLPEGQHTVWTSASDNLGNVSEQNVAVVVASGLAVSPSTGPIGTAFTLDGSGFGTYNGANTRVKFDGAAVAPITVWNDTQIKGRIPGALGPGQHAAVVERQSGSTLQTSDPFYFTVTAPEVATVTPSSGPIGVPFTLDGTSFGVYNGSYTRVLIGGTTAPVSLWNDTQIKGTIPGQPAGSKECVIEIATADGGLSRSATFYFDVVSPQVQSVTPSTASIGVPFTISGANFGPYNGANTRVLIGGTTAPISVWNDTTIQGTIPGIAEDGEKALVVERAAPDGGLMASATFAFTLVSPVATEIIPSTGPIGIPYTLNGYHFGNYIGANTNVLVNGATTQINVWTDTKIQGTIPGAEPGAQTVVVERKTADGGLRHSTPIYFTVAAMSMDAVAPSSGPIGIPFTLTGNNFGNYNGNNTRVMIGVSTAPITVWNNTTIQGTIPGLASGEYELAIERVASDGTLMRSATMPFLITTPAVASMSPSAGPIGIAYTLNGASFGLYNGTNTQVLIGGTTTAISLWNDTKIQGTIPGLANGPQAVIVQRKTADGFLSASSSFTYTVQGLAIASVIPSSGPIGVPFTITGSDFGAYNGNNTRVKVGVSTAAISVWNNTTIQGTIPGVVSGSQDLTIERVTADGGLMQAVTTFMVTTPAITGMSPASGPIGIAYTLNGASFGPYNGANTQVLIGGTTTAITVWN
ncbi:MAG TPA: IPT/TIG domain-containing protein, partial [Elusimicrobiales bacterium]|nr:IPT/TIG domain-containing protein [Elusimicrobiales bacterium]